MYIGVFIVCHFKLNIRLITNFFFTRVDGDIMIRRRHSERAIKSIGNKDVLAKFEFYTIHSVQRTCCVFGCSLTVVIMLLLLAFESNYRLYSHLFKF